MRVEERYSRVLDWFKENMPDAQTELNYENPYQLLVAVILSAQCTDKRVNQITPGFFSRFPDADSLASSDAEEAFEYIKSCSYPNSKSKYLYKMAKKLVEEFGGRVPSDIDELQKLPGVGRKTANVIASVIYEKPALAVDTHVFRVAARVGLTKNAKNPLDAEKQLMKHIPSSLVSIAHHWLILHGRYVCKARKPLCSKCGIAEVCCYYANNSG
ncbi:endonuclease III [Marinilabiliaceae bacterium ANBcel2]|nr:endonuclease III [Marinilabiliaceae bacterium ANBcel2]